LSEGGRKKSFWGTLYFRVLVGIVAGAAVGYFFPAFGAAMKPFGDGFLKLIRMLVAPIVFFTVVAGIAKVGDLKRLGRMGIKSLVYFEVVTTFALVLGLIVATVVKPGSGMNVDAATLDTKSIAQYTSGAHNLTATGFLLNIIPDTFLGAFASGEMLQVLLLAVLSGLALAMLREERLVELSDSLTKFFFKIVAIVMEAAPLGAFGAMAFTIGKYGVATLVSLGKLLACCYITSISFIAVVLGLICWWCGISMWRLVVYLREELLIVIGTSSSETGLPRLMLKLENLGCPKAIVGLVVPAGYAFNLDGTSIYLTIALLFIAQATNTHLSWGQQLFILFVLMLNSKGSATVTGGGLITLAGTLAALGTVPVAGIALILGIDRFLSEMRTITNFLGNGVATIVVSRWEGQFDVERARAVLSGHHTVVEDDELLREQAGVL
jgi:aerobic C4-dicarboxylate transport protein